MLSKRFWITFIPALRAECLHSRTKEVYLEPKDINNTLIENPGNSNKIRVLNCLGVINFNVYFVILKENLFSCFLFDI